MCVYWAFLEALYVTVTSSPIHVVTKILLSPPFWIHVVTKTSFVISSSHHMPLKRDFSPSLFLSHVLVTNWKVACSSTPPIRFVTSHPLPSAYFQKCPTNICSPWRWQLQCMPKWWIIFNILHGSFLKTEVAHKRGNVQKKVGSRNSRAGSSFCQWRYETFLLSHFLRDASGNVWPISLLPDTSVILW